MIVKSKTKFTSFEFGAIHQDEEKETVQFELPKTQFRIDSLTELASIKEDKPRFLPVVAIEESEKHIQITYQVVENTEMLLHIKNELEAVKLAIAKTILEQDVLAETEQYVSLHPATIYYKPMSSVYYTYRATERMPQEQLHSNLERYRALTLSILSGLTYEQCLNQKETIFKGSTELMKAVITANSREEILALITEANNHVTYEVLQTGVTHQKRNNKRILVLCVVSLCLLLGAVVVTNHVSAKGNQLKITEMEKRLAKKQAEKDYVEAMTNKDYTAAAKLMKKAGKSNTEIADMYFQSGQYQQAMNQNPALLETIIEKLYADDHQSKIVDLVFTSKTKEADKANKKLTIEKAIAAYDVPTLQQDLAFLEDEKTGLRMGLAYVEHNDNLAANDVYTKFPSKKLKNAMDIKDTENQIEQAKNELKKINVPTNKDKNKAQKMKIQQDAINRLTNTLATLKAAETKEE
ncbi:hypothetical protein [Listeria booriae]|uniref:hypothetical protein n=1 Tax=Listeria booriae TaxID=1552123 RepID=UPI00162781E1|nr:hypothetical protein [Listeria booriae]MBC2069295.1 hypothetical protein [Listeria booriae]